MMGASSFSVAASRSSRVRARSAASTGLRQATSRSPGKSGEVISARSCWSNRDSWSGPSSAISLLDGGGAQRGDPPVGVRPLGPVLPLVQGPDPGAGDHPAVADHDHLGQPELLPHHVHDGGERGGVAGVAGEDPDRDRAPGRVGEQPVLDLQPALLAVPGVAAGGQRAVPAFQPRGLDRSNSAIRAGLASGARWRRASSGLDRVLPVFQPVHRRVDVIGGRPGHAEVGAQRGVGPPGQGGQLGAGPDDPGDDQRQGQVPLPARRAEQRGQPQLAGHGVHGGDVAVRQRPR